MDEPVTIIIADDHAVLRRTVRILLDSQENFEVVGEAADGREALRLARELQPRVAILDVHMPKLDGIETARQMGQLPSPPAVIILTMLSARDVVIRAFEAGSLGFVLKASIADELVDAIHEALEDRWFLSAPLQYLQSELEELFPGD